MIEKFRAATLAGALAVMLLAFAGVAEPALAATTASSVPQGQSVDVSKEMTAVSLSQREDFINAASPIAVQVHSDFDIPASAMLGQAIIESRSGASGQAVQDKNFFGIKCASSGSGPIAIGCHDWVTQECKPAPCHDVHANFRVYASMTDSFRDYGRMITTSPTYADVLPYRHDPDEYIRHVAPHYATDPAYVNSIISVMQSENLYRFDVSTPPPPVVGSVPSSQTVYEANTQTTEVFARNADNHLIHTWVTNGVRLGWNTIDEATSIQGNPTTLYEPDTQTTEVFARNSDNHLVHTYLNSAGWTPLLPLGDWTLASDPVALYEPDTHTVEVFARGTDNKLIHTWLTAGGWQPWNVIAADTTFQGDPAPVYEPDTHTVEVFARSTDNHLVHTYLNSAGWTAWLPLDQATPILSNPAPIYEPDTHTVEVFARNSDNHLVHTYLNSAGWTPLLTIGDWAIAGDPAPVYQTDTHTVDVFARGADGLLIHTYLNSAGWTPWLPLGDWTLAGDPMPVYQPNTHTTDVYARGGDNHLIHTWLADTGWQPWAVIGPDQTLGA